MARKRVGKYSYSVITSQQRDEYEKKLMKADMLLNKPKIIHFGMKLKYTDENHYKMSKENYVDSSRKSSFHKYEIYTEEKYNEYYKDALLNYDINMRKFCKITQEEFQNYLSNYITTLQQKGIEVNKIYELKDITCSGVYLMILGKYKQIYIGASKNMAERIKQHWVRKKPIDRLVFGSIEHSKISIECYKALDTTEIYAVKTKNDTEAFKIEHTIIELADEKYVMNRIEGGRPDNFEGLICKIF